MSADANPNATNKSVTYTWNDANGDRRYQLGEEIGQPTASTLAGNIQFDPEIKQPYSHDVALYLERQMASSLATRVGFVYKTEDDLITTYNPYRPISAYAVAFPFTDIGEDGRSGTADDRVITLYGVPAANANTVFPTTNVVMNTGRFSRYKTVEASANKRLSDRWSLQAGGSYTWSHDFPEGFPNDPNAVADVNRTRWDFKLSGIFEGPYELRFSPLLRHQAGQNFARTLTVGSSVAQGFGAIYSSGSSSVVYAELGDARRHDNITVLDLRIERGFTLPHNMRIRGFLDLFNITNSNAAETRTMSTGSSFLRPTAVLAPRTARLGARFSF